MQKNKKRDMMKGGKLESVLFQISIYIIPLTLFVIFWFGINFNSILLAFQDISIKDGSRSFMGLANFKVFINDILGNGSDQLLKTSFINSIKMFLINFCICVPLYMLFSYYLFKKMALNRLFLILIMVPSIISEFIISIIFKRFVNVIVPEILTKMGVANPPVLLEDAGYTFGTMLFFMIWVSFSTSLIVYSNAMRSINGEIFESARIDGAGFWIEFKNIVFPLIFPTFSTFVIMGVAGIFLNGGPVLAFFQYNAYPEVYTVGYYYTAKVMNAVNETEFPVMAAGGLVLTAISCPLTFGVKFLMEKLSPCAEM